MTAPACQPEEKRGESDYLANGGVFAIKEELHDQEREHSDHGARCRQEQESPGRPVGGEMGLRGWPRLIAGGPGAGTGSSLVPSQ